MHTNSDLVKIIEQHGSDLRFLCMKVRKHIRVQRDIAVSSGNQAEVDRLNSVEPERWLAMASTDFQNALMKITRSVEQPLTF